MARKSKAVASAAQVTRSPETWLWALLFGHLGLSPVLFSLGTLEPFDSPKSLLLQVVGCAALGWLVASLVAKADGVPRVASTGTRWLSDPLTFGMGLFAISAILSTAFSVDIHTSIYGAEESFASLPALLSLVVLFFATRRACLTWADRRGLVLAAVMGGGVASAYAILQSVGFDVFVWSRVSEFGGLRPFGTLGNANTLAAFGAAIWPLTVCFAVLHARRGARFSAATFAALALIIALAVVRSSSRAGWLGLGIGVVGMVFLLSLFGEKRAIRRLLAIGVAVLLVCVVVPPGRDALLNIFRRLMDGGGMASRRFLWTAAIGIFREHPWLGSGVDTFGLMFSPRRTPEFWAIEWNTTFVRAHNEFLQVLATQGLLGACALVFIVAGTVRSSLAAWRVASPPDRLFAGGLILAILALLPQASLGLLQTSPAVVLFTLLGVMSASASRAEGTPVVASARTRVRGASIALSFVIFGVMVFHVTDWQGSLASQALFLAVFAAPILLSVVLPLVDRKRPREAATVYAQPKMRRTPFLIAMMAGAGLAVLWLSTTVAANRLAARAMRVRAADPPDALRLQRQAVEMDPKTAAYHVRLAQLAQGTSVDSSGGGGAMRHTDASDALVRAVALQPLVGQYEMLLCRALASEALATRSSFDEALGACDRAIAKEPDNPYFYTAAVNVSVQAKDPARARLLVDEGLRRFPDLGPLLYQSGFILLQEGRLDEAEVALRAADAANWHGQDAGRSGVRAALEEVARRRSIR